MIKLENYEAIGWQYAIHGMRNPMNSWAKSDSWYCGDYEKCDECPALGENSICTLYNPAMKSDPIRIGSNDHELMRKLAKAGPVHGKYRRMITVYVDITAPLYWWKEFDTYKVGTVANSCSTMHKIHEKEFTLEDFSTEHLLGEEDMLPPEERGAMEDDMALSIISVDGHWCAFTPKSFTELICDMLNTYRERYLETNDKKYWWQMIQLLPSSYNQKRTIKFNYEVLANIYRWRKDHKLDEWVEFCEWIKTLPYSEIITLEEK
jgi:hypothetical protein